MQSEPGFCSEPKVFAVSSPTVRQWRIPPDGGKILTPHKCLHFLWGVVSNGEGKESFLSVPLLILLILDPLPVRSLPRPHINWDKFQLHISPHSAYGDFRHTFLELFPDIFT